MTSTSQVLSRAIFPTRAIAHSAPARLADEAGYACSDWADPELNCNTAAADGHLSQAGQTKLIQV